MSTKNIENSTFFLQILTRKFNNSLEKNTCSNKLDVEETVTGGNLRQYRNNLRKSNSLSDQKVIVLCKWLSKFCQGVNGKF